MSNARSLFHSSFPFVPFSHQMSRFPGLNDWADHPGDWDSINTLINNEPQRMFTIDLRKVVLFICGSPRMKEALTRWQDASINVDYLIRATLRTIDDEVAQANVIAHTSALVRRDACWAQLRIKSELSHLRYIGSLSQLALKAVSLTLRAWWEYSLRMGCDDPCPWRVMIDAQEAITLAVPIARDAPPVGDVGATIVRSEVEAVAAAIKKEQAE